VAFHTAMDAVAFCLQVGLQLCWNHPRLLGHGTLSLLHTNNTPGCIASDAWARLAR
jgi:hypothetical protein